MPEREIEGRRKALKLKLSRFLFAISFITICSLLYVFQQTEVFRLAYDGQKKVSLFEDLLDKNTILRYNIAKSASIICIGSKVALGNDFQMPDTFRLVKLTHSLEGLKVTQYVPKKEAMIAQLFGIKRQAEANTINPSRSINP